MPNLLSRLAVRAGIAAVVVISAVVWVYSFVLADPTPTDKLADPSFAADARPICKAAKDEILAAGLIGISAATPQQRGDITARADEILRAMVDKLQTVSPKNSGDARLVSGWLSDWNGYLADRATWVADLKAGKDVPFLERAHQGGAPASKTMDGFTTANDLEACSTPDNY